MKLKISEIETNNYTVDFIGIGIKQFEFNPSSLREIIEQDLQTNYSCINYIKTLIEVEEGIYVATNLQDNTRLTIRLYLKTENCKEKENMLEVISSYLKQVFIN